ncbi:MAG: helix-turn-helix domain-containing protein [Blastocatellia bacterium]
MGATKQMTMMKDRGWTPALIKMLRGKRTQADFGTLIGVPKNTVYRWESGMVRPDARNEHKLSALARREGFLHDWQLAGSLEVIGDVEAGSRKIGEAFKRSVARSAKQLKA